MPIVIGEDPSAKLRTLCMGCAALLEYTRNEVQSYIHHDYGGGSDTVRYITCPRCGHQCNVRHQ